MARYKVRLGDGSVIGPMGADDLRSWFEKRIIDGDSLVQGEGSAGWQRLADAVDVSRWRGPAPRQTGVAATPQRQAPMAPIPQRTASRSWSAPSLPWKKIGIALLVGAIVAAVLWVGPKMGFLGGGSDDAKRIRAAATGERRFVDEVAGLTLELGSGWLILEKGQQVFPAPEDARVSLADPGSASVAYLVVESPPKGYASLDAYLSRFLDSRRSILPTLKEPVRDDATVGGIKARQLTGSWEAKGVRYRDVITVWKDGWTYFTLASRGPEGRGISVASATDRLLRGITLQGQQGRRLSEAVQKVTQEAPHLTPEAAEMVMGQSAAFVLEPPDAFRRAYQMLGQALPNFSAKDSQELGALHASIYAALGARDQGRLGRYIEGVRERQPTTPEDDREMSRLMKTAVLKLAPAKRARLQALFEQAIARAITVSDGG
jgi:hypothetical protein